MVLANAAIRQAIDSGQWTAHRDGVQVSSGELKIGPNSLDMSLSHELLKMTTTRHSGCVDLFDPGSIHSAAISIPPNSGYILYPGEFYLGCTRERINCNAPLTIDGKETYWKANYEGRSTMGRLGLESHKSAGLGDVGYAAAWTLEISVMLPTRVYAGVRIGQLEFVQVAGLDTADAYSGAYVGQYDGPRAPEIGRGRF